MENQHEMIKGYRDLTQDEIDAINKIKQAEIQLGVLWKDFKYSVLILDEHWMSIAKTHFEQGFMAFCRAVAKPDERFE